jgi:hypothetical protein
VPVLICSRIMNIGEKYLRKQLRNYNEKIRIFYIF